MAWGNSLHAYPRAIIHIDGDAFFASCEVAKNPSLRGKPVITGKERGIVSACTYEAKAMGVKRGMTLSEVKRVCPDAVILPSDYETYSLFSQRMFEIVRRYTPVVEEYSIDECFAELTGHRSNLHMSYPKIAAKIKHDLDTELGMTFSIGLSCTKTLAKIGSKWKKPSGLTLIPLSDVSVFLKATPTQNIWGIGANTSAFLKSHGIHTASEYVHKDERWIKANMAKPYQEIWRELRGEIVHELDIEGRHSYKSISKTKTFTPPSKDRTFIFSQLSKNVENACIKARRWNLVTKKAVIFLKTQEFRYHVCEILMPYPTNMPQDILAMAEKYFPQVCMKDTLYRSTGITIVDLSAGGNTQLDIFGAVERSEKLKRAITSLDTLSIKHGKHSVFLASSFMAMKFGAHLGDRGEVPARVMHRFKGETKRRRLGFPMLGEVT